MPRFFWTCKRVNLMTQQEGLHAMKLNGIITPARILKRAITKLDTAMISKISLAPMIMIVTPLT